ncbi:hypothetical protein [Olleya sp. HaHaR_3_96]|uniref:hypothetical protein n=1 Tax=Olleya sp. HaHaR_3_96 TaxID=2745560 RepID=UPI001C4FCB77|nr:hypothetical protein [Olleya sp. HaHaR_3_96]QXP58223.1 hypothetical protein H0I26_09830 [Olleya sp. HaHaR_3_96]
MGISKIVKLIFFFLIIKSVISCKEITKKEDKIITGNSIVLSETKEENTPQDKEYSQEKSINFVRKFYVLYLTDLNQGTKKCILNDYLSKNLIESVNNFNGNLIIDSQDYEKIDLNTLKISGTNIENVFKVSFINYDERTINVKVSTTDDSYKITDITLLRENVNFTYPSTDIVDEYEFDYLSYYIEPIGESKTGVVFNIEEDFEGRGIIFKKNQAFGDSFEYLCTKIQTKGELEIYYKENLGAEEYEYSGDSSKPLIIIYKKSNDFYARSSLIENGKEVKLKEE